MALNTAPLTRPRHIVISLALFALLAGGTGGIVGVAIASDEELPRAGPVSIPEPMVGDHGVYRLRVVDLPFPGAATDDLEIENEAYSGNLSFDFRAGQSIVDSDGFPHQVAVVGYDDQTPSTEGDEYWGAAAHYGAYVDTNNFATEAFFNQWYDTEEQETEQGTLTSFSNSKSMDFHDEIVRAGPKPVCGMIAPIQGSSVLGGETGSGLPACRYAHDRNAAQGDWVVLGTVQEGDRKYAVIQANGPGFNVRLWYEDGIPVPSRVEARSTTIWTNGDTLVAELTGFTHGGPESAFAAPPLKEKVELVMAPTTPLMFDETGIEHPFPVSEAYEVALGMDETGLAEFMANHPDAYIVDASFWAYHKIESDYERFSTEWRFAFREAEALLNVDIGKATYEGTPRVPANDTLLDELLAEDEPDPTIPEDEYYLFNAGHRDIESYGPWWPRPSELPTVASMWDYYRAMAYDEADGLEPNMWSWVILEANDEPRILVTAGRWLDTPSPEGGDYTYHREWAYLSWDVHEDERPYRYSQRFSVTSLPDEPAPGTHVHLNAQGTTFAQWTLPAKTAAAIGFGAGFIAFAYYVFPVVKSGVLGGMFSRVQANTALDNPARARILDLVRATPGVHFQALVRSSGLAEGNTMHHLRKLEEVGLILRKQTGGYTCFFEKGRVDRRVMDALAQVRSPAAQGILQSIVSKPGVSSTTLANTHGLAKGTVSYHVAKLRKAGLVEPGSTQPTELARRVASSSGAA